MCSRSSGSWGDRRVPEGDTIHRTAVVLHTHMKMSGSWHVYQKVISGIGNVHKVVLLPDLPGGRAVGRATSRAGARDAHAAPARSAVTP